MSDSEDVDQRSHVKLVSADGFTFLVHREAAMRSGTIRNMLSSPGQFTESSLGRVDFKDIKAITLEIVVRYLYWNLQCANSTSEIPEFRVEPEMALETLMAADFLDC
ncbi:hypothetical protein BZG36_00161 [Bifiguratus adelaidae]|uniref:Elongin-C n=1 Tax=Bifiguratus adelaidae TaxID=1938954 RepID=A0A261Y895_9FUNG|nr:hypothetical protein BZG36_00161 [Bifiguratus adelaidae]